MSNIPHYLTLNIGSKDAAWQQDSRAEAIQALKTTLAAIESGRLDVGGTITLLDTNGNTIGSVSAPALTSGVNEMATDPVPAVVNALEILLDWAHKANSRLAYERDEQGLQFGGNPFLNPVFKAASAALGNYSPYLQE